MHVGFPIGFGYGRGVLGGQCNGIPALHSEVLQPWENPRFPPISTPAPLAPELHHSRRDKMSDRDTLISMGFDPARVECESPTLRYPRIRVFSR